MAKPLVQTLNNLGNGGRMSQSYDSNSPMYGGMLLTGRPKNLQTFQGISVQNAAGAVAQVNTITIGTASTTALYEVLFAHGVDDFRETIRYQAVATDTAVTIQANLLAALRKGRISSRLSFASVASTIVVTSLVQGTNGGFDMTVTGGGASYAQVETTAPAEPADLQFGRILVAPPLEQIGVRRSQPNNSGAALLVRYPRTLADLDHIAGILLRSEYNGDNFMGDPIQPAALHPWEVGTVARIGEIAMDVVRALTPGLLGHVYLESAGSSKVGLLASAADGTDTAAIPAASFLKFMTPRPVAIGETSYIEVK
jgi:hypothetical protein